MTRLLLIPAFAVALSTAALAQGLGHGSAHGGGGHPGPASQSEATKAYLAAMDKMHGPMMEGVQASDPDVAFVKGMIPHHQGAIEMAKVRLRYGKDEETKRMAEAVIREQEREIREMQAWLEKHAR